MNILFISLTVLLFSSKVFSCDLQMPFRHLNPNQETGGLVDIRAVVNSETYIAKDAIVCGHVVIGENVKILDQSQVLDNAWIKSNTIIRGNSIVSGQSVIEGHPRYLTIIEGNSKIFGNSKVINGAQIKDFSELSGASLVSNSTVDGFSIVCGEFKVIDKFISSENYCSTKVSYASVLLNVIDPALVNPVRDFKLMLTEGEFHSDKNMHSLTMNGVLLTADDFEVYGNQIRIISSELLKNGFNEFQYKGYDSQLLSLKVTNFEFVTGNNDKQIHISNMFSKSQLKTEVELKYGTKKFFVKSFLYNDTVQLKYLPSELNSKLDLLVYNQEGYFAEDVVLDDIPNHLQLSYFPELNNENLDFSQGTVGWDISDPGAVEIVEMNGKNFLKLSPLDSPLIVKKTFSTKAGTESLNLDFSLLASALKDSSPEEILKIYFYSHKENKIQRMNFSDEDIQGMFVNKSNKPFQVSFENSPGDIVTLIVEVNNLSSKLNNPVMFGPPSELQYSISFTPYDFSVFNEQGNPSVDTLSNYNCDNPHLNIPYDRSRYNSFMEPLNYISAGMNTMMDHYENRLHGNLKISPNLAKNIQSINLLVFQINNSDFNYPKFSIPLHGCAYKALSIDSNGGYHFKPIRNLGAYLFSVPRTELEKLDASLFNPVSLVVEIVTKNGSKFRSSDYKPLTVLGVPNLPIRYTYKTPDNYNSNGYQFTRTGGDKFLHPRFLTLFTNYIHKINGGPTEQTPLWQVNDLSKINGGRFEPHSGHEDGDDADIAFVDGGFSLNFENWNSLSNWEDGLSKIESLLENSKDYFSVIEATYITADEDISLQGNKYVVNKFHNRCIEGNRYIDIFESKDQLRDVWQGTLLRNITGHRDHLHVRFNNERLRPGRPDYYPLEIPDFDESQIEVEIKDKKLLVNYPPSIGDNSLTFLWRAQKNQSFFPNEKTLFGNIPDMNTVPDDWGSFYIYFTLGKKGSGGCRQFRAFVTRDDNKDLLLNKLQMIMVR